MFRALCHSGRCLKHIDEPAGKAAVIWMVGEYGEEITVSVYHFSVEGIVSCTCYCTFFCPCWDMLYLFVSYLLWIPLLNVLRCILFKSWGLLSCVWTGRDGREAVNLGVLIEVVDKREICTSLTMILLRALPSRISADFSIQQPWIRYGVAWGMELTYCRFDLSGVQKPLILLLCVY